MLQPPYRPESHRTILLIQDIGALLALSRDSWPNSGPCARAAAMNAAILIESAANGCHAALPKLERTKHKKHGKVPQKFEAFLAHRQGTPWDPQHPEAANALEIVEDLRHFLTHPMPTDGTAEIREKGFYADFGQSNRLKVPYDTGGWNYDTASRIARAATSFLRVYFTEWCGMSKGDVVSMLIAWDPEKIDKGTLRSLHLGEHEFATLKQELPDVLDFLDLRWNDFDKLLANSRLPDGEAG